MGSGLGIGVGAITSGAIDRAVDRHQAESALKDAQDEYEQNYGELPPTTSNDAVAPSSAPDNDTSNIQSTTQRGVAQR